MKALGVMIDCSRDAVYSVEALKRYFALLRGMGYTYVQLYTEDVYAPDGEPYFGYLRGRYQNRRRTRRSHPKGASQGVVYAQPCGQA